jgi:magnesium and cobalt transporter
LDNDEKHEEKPVLQRIKSFLKGEKKKDLKQEIQEIIDEVEEKGFIDEDQGDMIQNIIVLRDTTVREVMVPKEDMVAVECSKALSAVVDAINASGYSLIPIYEKAGDNIIGVVHAKHILRYCHKPLETVGIRDVMQPPYFVPEGKKLIDLLDEFKAKQSTMAFVIDEYGNMDGLITLDDIMAEIVGDVQGDEDEDVALKDRGDGTFQVDPKMSISEFAEAFSVNIPEGDYDTVGGFITSMLERIPRPGESFQYAGMLFEIVGADKKKISRLIVHPPEGREA